MYLNKGMIEAFKQIVAGADTIAKLENILQKSQNRVSVIVSQLEEEGFIDKIRDGLTIKLSVSNRSYAHKLKDLMIEKKAIDFTQILAGTKILFLAALSEDWISIKEACILSGVSYHTAIRYYKNLLYRGMFQKNKDLYVLNERVWSELKEFIRLYKNYSASKRKVLWKFQEEELSLAHKEELVEGEITGLHAYKQYGVLVGTIHALCRTPKRKLSKEEVFVHSLFEVDDPRSLSLAITFYVKQNLIKDKVLPIAMRYGKYSMFTQFLKLFDSKEKYVTLEGLPTFDRQDFKRISEMYGVTNVFKE